MGSAPYVSQGSCSVSLKKVTASGDDGYVDPVAFAKLLEDFREFSRGRIYEDLLVNLIFPNEEEWRIVKRN